MNCTRVAQRIHKEGESDTNGSGVPDKGGRRVMGRGGGMCVGGDAC